MKRLTNILISAVVEPTAANDWLPANLPTTIISTALNINCNIPESINGTENDINLSIIVPLHISISYLFLLIVNFLYKALGQTIPSILAQHLFYRFLLL